MNFFQQQDRAKKRTGLLVLLFLLAVAVLIAATCMLVAGVIFYTDAATAQHAQSSQKLSIGGILQSVPGDTFLSIALATVGVVMLGSLFKIFQLSSGGDVVANQLGGRLVNVNTRNADEKKLLNIVEEMAIASGTPVPPVYLLDEPSINAFAAGTSPQNAAIGVTQGAIQQLDREQLQGVIAHEFSHIFNGDMRLNIRLMGVLNGILIFGIIGYYILRSGVRGNSRNGGAIAVAALGGGLMLIGYGGTFFGNLIKAAVSRQREFLADASAIQFTRNPDGLGGALKKLADNQYGSGISHPVGQEASHLFFGQAVSFFLNGLFATHPPIEQRIQRLDSSWRNGENDSLNVSTTLNQSAKQDNQYHFAGLAPVSSQQFARAVTCDIGNPGQQHYKEASQWLASLPAEVYSSCHEPYGARAIIYCLLLDNNESVRKRQLNAIEAHADSVILPMVETLSEKLQPFRTYTLELFDLSLPALKQLSDNQQRQFRQLVSLLINADRRTSAYEWSLYSLLSTNLRHKRGNKVKIQTSRQLKTLGRPLSHLLSVVARAGSNNVEYNSFAAAAEILGMPNLHLLDQSQLSAEKLDLSLESLLQLSPLQKPRLLKALAATAAHDGLIQPLEAQLIRAIALRLDCPMPPLLNNQ